MNHNYYDNPIYTENSRDINNFLDIVIFKNRGKKAKIFVSFPNTDSNEFEGIIESASKDHVIISNPNNGEWIIIPMIYLNYITLEEPIIY